MTAPRTFRLTLRAPAGTVDAERRLKALLKLALRQFGFRCLRAEAVRDLEEQGAGCATIRRTRPDERIVARIAYSEMPRHALGHRRSGRDRTDPLQTLAALKGQDPRRDRGEAEDTLSSS